jgi:hypothetical protein
MTGIESRANNSSDDSTDQKMRLWITLAVTTVMVALTAYVLSFALLGPGDNPPPHRSAAAMLHSRS